MSIIPASRLSTSDLALLGNNLHRSRKNKFRPGRRRHRLILSAVNRSLATVGEQIGRLHRPLVVA